MSVGSFGSVVGIGLISIVMTLMLSPMAGMRDYARYRTPLFVGGVIFMPLFVFIAAILESPVATGDKAWLLLVAFVGFWLSAAWLAHRRTQGSYVPGLEVRPMTPFRPDLLLPSGVLFVKGVIMMGIGMMIAFQVEFVLPEWNWWGFVLAFFGIIITIPIRGMAKMVKGRRPRLMGTSGASGMAGNMPKEPLLFLGLLVLLWGFIHAFMGEVPFTTFWPQIDTSAGLVGLGLLVVSFVILVPLRGMYKTKLDEGAETTGQLVRKQVLLWVGTLVLLYGYILMFMGEYMWFDLTANASGFWLGGLIWLAGTVLILVFRPRALRNEFAGFFRIMMGMLADKPATKREKTMTQVMGTVAEQSAQAREAIIGAMLRGISHLPPEKQEELNASRQQVMQDLAEEKRQALQQTMQAIQPE
jgi:hypothetical protein